MLHYIIKMPQLTEKQKHEIVFRNELMDMSIVNIAKEMNINRKTVSKWLEKSQKNETLERSEGSGRKKISEKK